MFSMAKYLANLIFLFRENMLLNEDIICSV